MTRGGQATARGCRVIVGRYAKMAARHDTRERHGPPANDADLRTDRRTRQLHASRRRAATASAGRDESGAAARTGTRHPAAEPQHAPRQRDRRRRGVLCALRATARQHRRRVRVVSQAARGAEGPAAARHRARAREDGRHSGAARLPAALSADRARARRKRPAGRPDRRRHRLRRAGRHAEGFEHGRAHGRRRAMVTCASPAYIARHGLPRTLDDLRTHRASTSLPAAIARCSNGRFARTAKPSR